MYEFHYEKNLSALKSVDSHLASQIEAASVLGSFELDVISEDYQLYNILDHMNEVPMFLNLMDDLKDTLLFLKSKHEYDYLYFFGIGNAYALPTLLSQPKHQRIVVIEPEAELLFVALHLYDFSQALSQKRLVLQLFKHYTMDQAQALFTEPQILHLKAHFQLICMASYYHSYYDDLYKKAEALCIEALEKNYHTLQTEAGAPQLKNLLAQPQETIIKSVKEGIDFVQAVETAYIALNAACEPLQKLNREAFLNYFEPDEIAHLLEHIAGIRQFIASHTAYEEVFYPIMASQLLEVESEVASIKIRFVENASDKKAKSMDWILIHQLWLYKIAQLMEQVLHYVIESVPDINWDEAIAALEDQDSLQGCEVRGCQP